MAPQLVSIARAETTSRDHGKGTRRVATLLAVLGISHFRLLLPEVPSMGRPHCCSLGPSKITFRMERRHNPSHCTAPQYTIQPQCEGCQAPLDAHDRRRAGWPRSGRLKKRATSIERVLARVYREAEGRVTVNAFLLDVNVGVSVSDGRRIEVISHASRGSSWQSTSNCGSP